MTDEPTVRVRYLVPVTVDGKSYSAGTYEAEVSAEAARDLIAARRAISAETMTAIEAAQS